jgi:hypothetical protein
MTLDWMFKVLNAAIDKTRHAFNKSGRRRVAISVCAKHAS